MSVYLKKNAIPLSIEIIFIISCFVVPSDYYIYTNFVFYLSLLIYFIAVKDFSLKEWIENLKQGKAFWKSVFITAFFFISAFVITMLLENAFPHFDTGTIRLKTNTWFKAVIFAASTIILPPIVEEMFYRKNLIISETKRSMVVTMLLSMFLYAAEHSLTAWGIFLSMIWALPLSLSYVKTKNVFVPMTAHSLINFIINGADLIFVVIAML